MPGYRKLNNLQNSYNAWLRPIESRPFLKQFVSELNKECSLGILIDRWNL
jgi:hypothetical protein